MDRRVEPDPEPVPVLYGLLTQRDADELARRRVKFSRRVGA